MNISGKILTILPEVKGEGKNGPWTRQDFIIETGDQYPKKVCASVWNNKIRLSDLKSGDTVDLEITVESREFNGRWYTDVKVLGVTAGRAMEGPAEYSSARQAQEPFPHTKVPDDLPAEDAEDDVLPF
jgi:hypothetical protein